MLTMDGVEVFVQYRPLTSAVANDYMTAKDWIGRYRYHDVVDRIVSAIEQAS